MNPKPTRKIKLHQRLWGVIQTIAALFTLFSIFSDVIRGRDFSFGKAQYIAVAFGLLVFALASLGKKLQVDLLGYPIAVWAWSRQTWVRCANWLETTLKTCGHSIFEKLSERTFETIILVCFALFSTIYTLGRWNGVTPFIYLGGDASYIASYAHSFDQPGLFANDYYLSNNSRVDSYLALHIPLIRTLKPLVGDYGSAFLVLLPFALFFSLFGFYWLGKKLFRKRWVALLFAIVTFPIVYIGVSDYWGITQDVLPRNLFEIAFPWILYYCIEWRDQPRKWWGLFLALGLLTYVHSISAAVIVVTLALVWLTVSKAPIKARILTLVYSTAIYLIAVLPFAFLYFGYFKSAEGTSVPYAEKAALLLQYFGSDRYDFVSIFSNLLQHMMISGILPLAILALLILWRLRKNRDLQAIKTVAFFIFGICFVSIVCPLIELQFDSRLQLLSQSMLIVRGIRFIPPLLITLAFLVFFGKEDPDQSSRYPHAHPFILALCVVIMFIATILANQQDSYFTQEITCLSTGHLTCETQQQKDAVDILSYINQHTDAATDTFLTVDIYRVIFANAIRYQASRSMGYNNGDQVRMRDDPVLQNAIDIALKPWGITEHINPKFKLLYYFYLAKSLHTNYLIVQIKDFPPTAMNNFSPVYRNENYALLKANLAPLPTYSW